VSYDVLCCQTGKMARYFGDLELFAMLVACLTHNVGFRGMSYSMLIRFVIVPYHHNTTLSFNVT